MQEELKHGCVKENRWWLVSIRPEKHLCHTFISPAFLKTQAIYRLQVAFEKYNKEHPNSKTAKLIQAIQDGKADAELLRLDCCYTVSYFDDSRSYANSAMLEEIIKLEKENPISVKDYFREKEKDDEDEE